MKRFSLSLLFLLVLSACAHREVKPPTGLTQNAFWKAQALRRQHVDRLSAKLRLTFYGNNRSISGRGQLLREPGDKVRLELRDPFGRVHYMVAQKGKQFTALYPRRHLAYVDAAGGNRYIREFLGLDFTFDSLQEIFLGLVPGLSDGPIEGWEWDGETGEYVGTVVGGDKRYRIRVDGESARLNALTLVTEAGEIEAKYSQFEPCCRGVGPDSPVDVAGVVELKLPRGPTGMDVEWEKIRVLDKPRPADVYRIRLTKKDKVINLK